MAQPADVASQLASSLSRVWTPPEREAWRILERGILGFTFHRHALLNGKLVGFYCPELGILLQLDGSGASGGESTTDTTTLHGVHLKVARVPANEVTRSRIVAAIEQAVKPGTLWPED